MGDGGFILAVDGWWWLVVAGDGYILVVDGLWWLVVDIFLEVVGGDGYVITGGG